jgi:shikimate dehydrogenase
MRTFGLIGYPLSHSFSEKYFTEKFKQENITDCEFRNFPLEDITKLQDIIKNNPTLCGLSVTIPHKRNVIPFLNEIDEAAKEIGAVNCIHLPPQSPRGSKGVRLIGYNTDAFGFEKSLKPLLKPHHSQALILGTGGASKAVAYILEKYKIKFSFISRAKNKLSYSDLTQSVLKKHSLIINTTPVGMFPNVNECPDIPYHFLSQKHLLYDLTYNPEETLFLKKGKEKGAQIKNGLEMLHLQAEKAWEIWNSNPL